MSLSAQLWVETAAQSLLLPSNFWQSPRKHQDPVTSVKNMEIEKQHPHWPSPAGANGIKPVMSPAGPGWNPLVKRANLKRNLFLSQYWQHTGKVYTREHFCCLSPSL